MGEFTGAQIVELRIYTDPQNPETSAYTVALPSTVLDAVFDQRTGESLNQILAKQTGGLDGHIYNNNVHVTDAWKQLIQQAISDLTGFSSRTDIFVTVTDKDRWNKGTKDAADALAQGRDNAGDINDLNGRIIRIEDSIFNDLAANPFQVNFESLEGLNIERGVWNNGLRRVEC